MKITIEIQYPFIETPKLGELLEVIQYQAVGEVERKKERSSYW